MMKKSVGIYANKNTLQFVVLTKGFNKVKLVAADSIKIPQGELISLINVSAKPVELPVGKAGKKPVLTSFESAVKEVLNQNGIKDGQVVSSAVPPECVVIRYFHMSRLAPGEHKTAIPFEARKYLPYKLEDAVYAYSVSYDKVASNKMAVTFVAADKNYVAKYVRFFENLGLRIGYLEVLPYSLIRFLYQTKDIELAQTVALINVTQDLANISLVRNKVLYLTRNVSFSGKPEQAAITLSGQDSSHEEDQDSALNIKFENLLSEVRLSFDYFHRQFPEEKIEKVIVWADDRKIQEKFHEVGKELNMYIKTTSPFDCIEKGGGYSVDYAVGVGLALRGMYQHSNDINLSVGIKKIEVERLFKIVATEFCVAVGLLIVFNFADSGKIRALDAEFKDLLRQSAVSGMDANSFSKEAIENEKIRAEEKLNYIESLVSKKNFISSKIPRAANLLPEGLWLDKMEYSKSKNKKTGDRLAFTIKGYAYRLKGDEQIRMINNFLESLKKDSLFSSGFVEIKLDFILNETHENMPVTGFQIICFPE